MFINPHPFSVALRSLTTEMDPLLLYSWFFSNRYKGTSFLILLAVNYELRNFATGAFLRNSRPACCSKTIASSLCIFLTNSWATSVVCWATWTWRYSTWYSFKVSTVLHFRLLKIRGMISRKSSCEFTSTMANEKGQINNVCEICKHE